MSIFIKFYIIIALIDLNKSANGTKNCNLGWRQTHFTVS